MANGEMMNARQALFTATAGGARALRLEEQVGGLSAGMQADIVILRLDGVHQRPVYDAASTLVFSSSARDVRLAGVAGREVFRDGRVLTVDEERLGARMKEIQEKCRRQNDE